MPRRVRVATIALSMAFCSVGASCLAHRSATDERVRAASVSFRRMLDGTEWMTENLKVNTAAVPLLRRRRGELPPIWPSLYLGSCPAGMSILGDRVAATPTDGEWRQLAKGYGGIDDESADSGRAAYQALLTGGNSGFNAVLGGGRDDGRYARLEAHGFYWTASETTRPVRCSTTLPKAGSLSIDKAKGRSGGRCRSDV